MLKLRIGEIRKALRININKLLATILGEDVLSKEEREELESLGKLPKKSLRLIDKAFILGRLKSILTSKETKSISYEELVEHANNIELNTIEKLAVQHAKLKAAANIKNIAEAIASSTMTAVQGAATQALNEATLKQTVQDETAIAILQKKTYQDLASTLADKLKQVHGKDWELIAQTELHAAKTQGIAQAIINGVDVYQGRGGPDARVSVVPKPTACEDCKAQYLDSNGNPKIFLLSELIEAGSNANSVHSKRNGIHVFWKPTLPPLHPRCRCDLQYIPDGAFWQDGKLVMSASIAKAIGDSALSATVKPKGPRSAQKPTNTPSLPGAPSPAQGATAMPKAKGTDATQKASLPGNSPGGKSSQDYVPCPLGGGDECKAAGGSGASQHSSDGQSMKNHREYMARQGKTLESPEETQQKELKAKEFNNTPHNNAVKLDHMQNGHIESVEKLGGGATDTAFKVRIAGNGHGVMKTSNPYQNSSELSYLSGAGDGNGATARGEWHKKEAAAYHFFSVFGLNDHVPPTAVRAHPSTGEPVSVQSWADGYSSAGTYASKMYASSTGTDSTNTVQAILHNTPEQFKEKIKNKLSEGSVMDIVMNHCDRHLDNVMVSDDFSDLKFIDNATSFGTSMLSHKNHILRDMHRAGMKLKVPDHLMERFSKTTLGDLKRSMSGHLSDWEVGQSFLRMKYVEYLQKNEGHLDFNKFRGVIASADGSSKEPRHAFWGPKGMSEREEKTDFWEKEKAGLLPHQMFDSFAKQWIEDSKSLPEDHQDRIAAEELEQVGVFMGLGFAADPTAYRNSGKHREYEKSIKPGYPPKHVHTASGIITPEAAKMGSEATMMANMDQVMATVKKDPSLDEKTAKPKKIDRQKMLRTKKNKSAADIPDFDLGDTESTKKSIRLYIRLD